jgi:hypothetical protein
MPISEADTLHECTVVRIRGLRIGFLFRNGTQDRVVLIRHGAPASGQLDTPRSP